MNKSRNSVFTMTRVQEKNLLDVYKLANLTHNQKGEKVNRNRSRNYRNVIFYFWIWNVHAKTLKQLL